jgi:hypothetical protein
MKQYLDINALAERLRIKRSTLYAGPSRARFRTSNSADPYDSTLMRSRSGFRTIEEKVSQRQFDLGTDTALTT